MHIRERGPHLRESHVRQLQSAHRLGRFTNIVSAVHPLSCGGTEFAAFSESTGLELDNDGKTNRVDTVVFEARRPVW